MMKNLTFGRILGTGLAIVALASYAIPATAAQGMVKIKGSDTVLPLAAAWAEAYMKNHPNAMISVTGGGSGVGLASLINGSCDIADASRAAKPKEINQARDRNVVFKATTVAKDGLAIVVHPRNPLSAITTAQLKKLFSTAQTWKEVGGSATPVIATGRDSSSGTYVFFQDTILGGRRYRQDMLTLPSNNAICQTVSEDLGAVGYVGLAFAKEFAKRNKVKIIPVNGVAATDENVKNGKYPLWRPLYCYTNGRASGTIADYLKFVTSSEGQKLVEKVGYVPAH